MTDRFGIGPWGRREVDAAPYLKILQENGMIVVDERALEREAMEAHRARLPELIEASAAAAKERMKDVLTRLMPSATVRRQGDEFEIEFRDAVGANQIIMVKVTDSTVAEREAGFDLTDFGTVEKAMEAWNELGLDTRPILSKERCYVWAGDGLEIVAANDPFTGKEKGYAGYMGIRGKKTRVAQAIKAIKKYGDYKDFEDGVLGFIGFPEA